MPRTFPTATDRGILHPEQFHDTTRLVRHEPCGELAGFVENYWSVSWDLPPGVVRRSAVLAHPAVSLSVESGGCRPGAPTAGVYLTGLERGRFEALQSGRGGVAGVKFRPGGLTALTGITAVELVDRTVPAARLLPEVAGLTNAPFDAALAAPCFDEYLRRFEPERDERHELVLQLVHRLLVDTDVTRVEQLAAAAGMSTRSLQRLFRHYVGVGPKWLLTRYRLHDAVERLDAGFDGSLASLAAELGWTDQAHFTREFTALVGEPPSEYRQRERQPGWTARSPAQARSAT